MFERKVRVVYLDLTCEVNEILKGKNKFPKRLPEELIQEERWKTITFYKYSIVVKQAVSDRR